MPDLLRLDFSISTQSFSRAEPPVSPFGSARTDSSLPAHDYAGLGILLSARSLQHPGSTVFLFNSMQTGRSLAVLDFLHLELIMSLRSFACMGLSLPAFDTVNFDASPSSQGSYCLGLPMLPTASGYLGFTLSACGAAPPDNSSLACGITRLGLSPPVPAFSHYELPFLPHGFSWLDSLILLLDHSHSGVASSLRSLA